MTLPYDMPDNYPWMPGGKRALLTDLGELAARLGSIVVYDRRGQVVWLDRFDGGLSAWTVGEYGTGAAVKVITSGTYWPGYAIELVAGSDGLLAAEITHEFPMLEETRAGVEISVAVMTDFQRVGVSINRIVSEARLTARIRIYNDPPALKYTDAAGNDQTIATVPDPVELYGLYHHLKVVADFASGEYVRVLYNETEYDVSGVALYQAALAVVDHYDVVINHKGRSGNNDRAGVGHVIVTVGEP